MAHDIKTPIIRLRANAEIALRGGRGDEDWREALATTIENSEQIISLVDVLMDVSEAECGSMKFENLRLFQLIDARP